MVVRFVDGGTEGHGPGSRIPSSKLIHNNTVKKENILKATEIQ